MSVDCASVAARNLLDEAAQPAFVRAEGPLGTHVVELSKNQIAKR